MTNNNNDMQRRAELQSEEGGSEKIKPMLPDSHSSAHPAIETPVEARQGFLGRPILVVLIGALALSGIAWMLVHYTVR